MTSPAARAASGHLRDLPPNCSPRDRTGADAITNLAAIRHAPPRARGALNVVAKAGARGSALARLEQSGSARMLTERGDGPVAGVILNTAGGLTGGDRFRIAAEAGTGAHLRLTTQAAERVYRSPDASAGRIDTVLRTAPGGRLDWLPQETIVYDGGRLDRTLTADLAPGSRCLIVEPVLFGRLGMGETVRAGRFRDRVTIRQGGETVFRDATDLSGDIAATLDRPGVAMAARAMALLILSDPDAGAWLERLRAGLPETAGASLVRDGLLIARFLAPDGFTLRRALVPALELLTRNSLPRSWRL